MSNLLKWCCLKDPKRSPKMDQVNGMKKCPLSEDSEKERKISKPNLRVKVSQPIRLKNHILGQEACDTLYSMIDEHTYFELNAFSELVQAALNMEWQKYSKKSAYAGIVATGGSEQQPSTANAKPAAHPPFWNTQCTERVCETSIMGIPNRGDTPRPPEEVYQEAQAFLRQYFASIRRENTQAHTARLEGVKKELNNYGTYQLKSSELVYGTKLAWRNATRCIGRIQWKKLQVFDCREVTTARGMFEALCNHIKYATNKGNLRSAITVFPQRTDGKHDYRIWNPQLISYAGYRQGDGTVLGDPYKAEFTEVCLKLGWKPPRTAWDILPLVLSADGKDPEFFDIPKEIVLEIYMEHPEYDWFKELGIRWYALPAVSNMRMDCGGLEFTGTAFNGWYMSTEIGCRNLSDESRYNLVQKIATKMGLDTTNNMSLWKDKALVEINIAVLHSFHRDTVSIVDHHSASEQFMKHLDDENKSRGGCPADWVWIVPPMSASLTQVFHQEMALYYIRPSYDYQDPPWKSYQWNKSENSSGRKFHFKQIARAVKFTSKLFGRALSKRIKATILYASETGKSEQYAKELGTIFGHAFNAQVHCMSEYDMFSIEHETLLLIVASTFGNGEAPGNGVDFADYLFQMLSNENNNGGHSGSSSGNQKLPTPKSLMRTNSLMTPSIEYKRPLSRLESNKSSIAATSSVEHLGPLSNVRYAVFALGSSAYPKFCNFGKTVDRVIHELGGERILEVTCGDELYGQEQQFKTWSSQIFHEACEQFCLEEFDMVKEAKKHMDKLPLTEETVRFGRSKDECQPLHKALENSYKKNLISCKVKENKKLGDYSVDRMTVFVDMEAQGDLKYDPGDHVGVLPRNRKEIVDSILKRCKDVDQPDKCVQLQVMKETLSVTGALKTWERHERIPAVTIRQIYTQFLDITTPPSTKVLNYLAKTCSDDMEAKIIMDLATDSNKYDDWRHFHYPHLGEVLAQFPTCRPQASLLAALLPSLQPRFYSISSSPLAHGNRIHVTVAVVTYNTQTGNGPTHYGVCSTYLQNLKNEDEVLVFIRRAPSFHMPRDISAPLILVGPGSGIAPFRGFWHQRRHQIKSLSPENKKPGPIWLFFGCRSKSMDLYEDEKQEALAEGVLTKLNTAFSREKGSDKKHVQDLLEEEGAELTRMLLDEDGHFYVCGDCKMAEEVQQKLKTIIKKHANMSDQQVDNLIVTLMDENRYHEDIFGITLRTAEVNSASREFAKRSRQASSQSQP